MTEVDGGSRLSWPRAAATTLAILVVAVGLLLYGSNLMLTKLTGLSRSGRVGVTTVWFFAVFFSFAAALRWLQRRRLI
jgi:hypothetical protein